MIARADLIAMYSAYPGALEAEVAQMMSLAETDEQRVERNSALRRIVRLIGTEPGQKLMWQNVARAILETAVQEPIGAASHGQT